MGTERTRGSSRSTAKALLLMLLTSKLLLLTSKLMLLNSKLLLLTSKLLLLTSKLLLLLLLLQTSELKARLPLLLLELLLLRLPKQAAKVKLCEKKTIRVISRKEIPLFFVLFAEFCQTATRGMSKTRFVSDCKNKMSSDFLRVLSAIRLDARKFQYIENLTYEALRGLRWRRREERR
jgi:hypothetical protein